MSNHSLIEIPDSDDESATTETKLESTEYGNTKSSAGEITPIKNEDNEDTAEKEMLLSSSSSFNTTNTSSPTYSDVSLGTANSSKQNRHRARKTQHQAFRISPTDIQFETIALDDGDDSEVANLPKMPKILKDLTLPEQKDKMKSIIGHFLESEEAQAIIKRIAEERVRCNFLLATYHLPDMNFSLNTPVDTLKQQFRDRLRQRKERGPRVLPPTNIPITINSGPAPASALAPKPTQP